MLGRRFLEKLYDDIRFNEEIKDEDRESRFLYDKTFEFIEKYTDPQYDKNYVADKFNDIISSYGDARQYLGFKHGLTHALKLTVETMSTPERTAEEIRQVYDYYYKDLHSKPPKRVGDTDA